MTVYKFLKEKGLVLPSNIKTNDARIIIHEFIKNTTDAHTVEMREKIALTTDKQWKIIIERLQKIDKNNN